MKTKKPNYILCYRQLLYSGVIFTELNNYCIRIHRKYIDVIAEKNWNKVFVLLNIHPTQTLHTNKNHKRQTLQKNANVLVTWTRCVTIEGILNIITMPVLLNSKK